jgi:hypothetical protein
MILKTLSPRQATKATSVFESLAWVIFGLIPLLWWLPHESTGEQSINWKQATLAYFVLLAFAFNHLPNLGMRRFFTETPYILLKLFFIVFVTAGYTYGLFVIA